MVTKERLRELIKEKATIYYVANSFFYNSRHIVEHKLTKTRVKDLGGVEVICKDKRFFETKEDAEFIANNWGEKLDRFEPPIYEQIKNGQPYRFNFTANGKHYNFFASVLLIELLEVSEEFCCNEQLICQSSTKERYLKAVEYAKKLFLGEDQC